jgi:hypothetical protein
MLMRGTTLRWRWRCWSFTRLANIFLELHHVETTFGGGIFCLAAWLTISVMAALVAHTLSVCDANFTADNMVWTIERQREVELNTRTI